MHFFKSKTIDNDSEEDLEYKSWSKKHYEIYQRICHYIKLLKDKQEYNPQNDLSYLGFINDAGRVGVRYGKEKIEGYESAYVSILDASAYKRLDFKVEDIIEHIKYWKSVYKPIEKLKVKTDRLLSVTVDDKKYTAEKDGLFGIENHLQISKVQVRCIKDNKAIYTTMPYKKLQSEFKVEELEITIFNEED